MKLFPKLVSMGAVAALSTVASAATIISLDQSGSGALGTISLGPQPNGTTIQGVADDGAFLNFTSNEMLLSYTGGGQARIEAVDGSWSSILRAGQRQ